MNFKFDRSRLKSLWLEYYILPFQASIPFIHKIPFLLLFHEQTNERTIEISSIHSKQANVKASRYSWRPFYVHRTRPVPSFKRELTLIVHKSGGNHERDRNADRGTFAWFSRQVDFPSKTVHEVSNSLQRTRFQSRGTLVHCRGANPLATFCVTCSGTTVHFLSCSGRGAKTRDRI